MGKSKYPPTSFMLEPRQKARLRKEAKEAKLSMSEFIRRKLLGDNYKNDTAA